MLNKCYKLITLEIKKVNTGRDYSKDLSIIEDEHHLNTQKIQLLAIRANVMLFEIFKMNRIDLAEKCSEYVEYIHSVFYGLAEPNKGFEHNFFLTMNLAQFSQKFKISETCLSLVKKSKKTLSLESEKGSDPRIGDESTFPKLC